MSTNNRKAALTKAPGGSKETKGAGSTSQRRGLALSPEDLAGVAGGLGFAIRPGGISVSGGGRSVSIGSRGISVQTRGGNSFGVSGGGGRIGGTIRVGLNSGVRAGGLRNAVN